jgi:hypothetical protein
MRRDDDAPWIQARIDASRGRRIVVDPGDYMLGTTVHVPEDVALDWRDSRITFNGDDGPAVTFHGTLHPMTRLGGNVLDGGWKLPPIKIDLAT